MARYIGRPVTVDTGGLDDVWAGCNVHWLHTPRGGYGYTLCIPAKVVQVTRSLVTIEVERKDGSRVQRHVRPQHLRHGAREDVRIQQAAREGLGQFAKDDLAAKQTPLTEDVAKVLRENLWALYGNEATKPNPAACPHPRVTCADCGTTWTPGGRRG